MNRETLYGSAVKSVLSQVKKFCFVFIGCLAVGIGIGFVQGVMAFWREESGYMWFLTVQAAFAGGLVALVEGLALYVLTHRYMKYEDYRLVAFISLVGGCMCAFMLGLFGAGFGSMLVTPLITLVATVVILFDRYKKGNLR